MRTEEEIKREIEYLEAILEPDDVADRSAVLGRLYALKWVLENSKIKEIENDR